MESNSHIDLVERIVEYVKNSISIEEYDFIQVDSSGSISSMRVSDNYIPDVIYRSENRLIIGEAKTQEDFERKHSIEQFEAYLKDCICFEGEAMLVVAVPWTLLLTAQNFFRRIKNKNRMDVEIVILDNMGSEKII